MEKYKIEYFELKNKLKQLKIDIQETLEKYDKDENWDYFQPGQINKLMKVSSELYESRKWDWESYWYRYDWNENILDNYEEDCWVPIEDLENILELFIERKIAKRRIWFIKWLIIRKFLYY